MSDHLEVKHPLMGMPRQVFWTTHARTFVNKVLRRAGMSRWHLFSSRYSKPVFPHSQAPAVIKDILTSSSPAMICRIGGVENGVAASAILIASGFLKEFSQSCLTEMTLNAGIFPQTHDVAHRFSLQMLDDLREADCIGVWGNPYEDYLVDTYAPGAELVPLKAISPCENMPPWSSVLEGKKVVVVHPFAKSIESQYQRHRSLFEVQETLPDFELTTIKAVQSIANEKTPHSSWFEALDHMKGQLDAVDYDIALIGCGGYGLSLAAHVKRSGKKAVHIGGALQLLFGILGKRWEAYHFPTGPRFENWVRPSKEETPSQSNLVEGACYW